MFWVGVGGGVGLTSTFDPLYDSESDARSAWHESAPQLAHPQGNGQEDVKLTRHNRSVGSTQERNESKIAAELRSVKAELSNMRESIDRLCDAMAAKEEQDKGRWTRFGQEWFKNTANFRSIEKEIVCVRTAIG